MNVKKKEHIFNVKNKSIKLIQHSYKHILIIFKKIYEKIKSPCTCVYIHTLSHTLKLKEKKYFNKNNILSSKIQQKKCVSKCKNNTHIQ